MSKNLPPVFCVASLLPLLLLSGEKPNLSGTWELKTTKSGLPSSRDVNLKWVIVQDETKIRISEVALYPDGKEKKTDITCTTDGKECVTDSKSQLTKVSFWYNGPMLVEMDFGGRTRESVLKKRMKLTNDGAQMLVELIPMVGGGDSGNLVFEKR